MWGQKPTQGSSVGTHSPLRALSTSKITRNHSCPLGACAVIAYLFTMISIVKTTNAVRLSYLQALLNDAGIRNEVFDGNISALEAGIGAFPRRLMVDDARAFVAERVLRDAGEFYDD